MPFAKLLRKYLKNLFLFFFNFYKVFMRAHVGNACKFHPTCSEYSRDAFLRYSFFRALYLVSIRLLRCHPFSEGGLDPLPERKEK